MPDYRPECHCSCLHQHILRIRRYLGPSGARIETIRGAGYRLRD
ncbi:MAG: winged helix-turn-helix domain-containing protein [Kiritimatiellae bacterium]|nr:winged helix-turn-helix domain-containing protein [Kiritimatiellia bacterium]